MDLTPPPPKAPRRGGRLEPAEHAGVSYDVLPTPAIKRSRRIRPDSIPALSGAADAPMGVLASKSATEQETIKRNWASIRNSSHEAKVQSVYNIQLGVDDDVTAKLYSIFEKQKSSFKANCSLGSLLRNKNTGALRYFHSCQNNAKMFNSPFDVSSPEDFDRFVEFVKDEDFGENPNISRESSEWVTHDITNLTVYVNHTNHVIGANSKIARRKNGMISPPAHYNMCFFSCLVLHRYPEKLKSHVEKSGRLRLRREAKCFYEDFTKCPPEEFEGVTLSDISTLEQLFRLGIQIYSLDKTKARTSATLVKRASPQFKDRMVLDLGLNEAGNLHFSLVTDLKVYARCYRCNKCGQAWDKAWFCERHQLTCDTVTAEHYPKGPFRIPPTIFEVMADEVDVVVPNDKRYFPHFITYDFEAYMVESDIFESEHIPMSFSLCSNIPGLTKPAFFADENPERLVQTFLTTLNEWSSRSYELLSPVYGPYFDKIEEKANEIRKREPEVADGGAPGKNSIQVLRAKCDQWLRRIPVLGFNSQKYDLNMIKAPLIRLLRAAEDKEEDPKTNVHFTKKNNAIMAIETSQLRILDISNYLAPTSYAEYLKAFHVSETKGFFPYEYVKKFDQLYETALPPYEAFYSKLNLTNTLDGGEGECAGRQQWLELKKLWDERGMTCLMEFLEWYNNLDVTSFVEAVETQFAMFKEHLDIDIFKEGISLPGISLRYAMKTTDASFALYGKKFKDLHKDLREAVTGGPSIIFSRHQEKDVTKIRAVELGSKAEVCKAVAGVDANSLYLWSFAQDFPAGSFQVRHAPEFQLVSHDTKDYSMAAIRWIESVAKGMGVEIKHRLNSSGEVRIGARKYRVDGFLAAEDMVFEYQGCFYHGCPVCNKDRMDKPHPYYPGATFRDALEFAREKWKYLETLGYTVHVMWECAWNEIDTPPKKSTGKLTESLILDKVREGTLFGLVKVDIRTPDHLKQKLAEFPPIFKNCEVGREDISPFMRSYCEKAGSLKKPTRLLISSYYADHILLITPLLKYYMDMGLEVTKVHTVVEFPEHRPCFAKFADKVCEARRLGDKDPNSDILANTFKLVGNSAYGRVCMNKTKQTDTVYAGGTEATRLINQRRFKACSMVCEDIFEIESFKRRHVFDLPLHLGVFTYQYAKLRMLQWQYDFMQKYLPSSTYELAEMDTDSSYFGLSKGSLEECVPQHLKRDFYTNYDEWFPSPACAEHKSEFVEAKMAGCEWVPGACCEATKAFEKRTPGKFKFEFWGDGIVALCSKTYICFGDKETKLSCKGLQKKRNLEKLTKESYLKVLKSQQAGCGVNKGFRAVGGKVYTYEQTRFGLSYMYCKRKVLEDGISTTPLDL